MPRLYRPHIPISVKIEVAVRQCRHISQLDVITLRRHGKNSEQILAWVLSQLAFEMGTSKLHLDHNPALAIREFNRRTKTYTPDANDPQYLLYRSSHEHHIKTNVRGDGAQFPDRVLIKRDRKRLRKKRAKAKIPGRPLPGTKASGLKRSMSGKVTRRGK